MIPASPSSPSSNRSSRGSPSSNQSSRGLNMGFLVLLCTVVFFLSFSSFYPEDPARNGIISAPGDILLGAAAAAPPKEENDRRMEQLLARLEERLERDQKQMERDEQRMDNLEKSLQQLLETKSVDRRLTENLEEHMKQEEQKNADTSNSTALLAKRLESLEQLEKQLRTHMHLRTQGVTSEKEELDSKLASRRIDLDQQLEHEGTKKPVSAEPSGQEEDQSKKKPNPKKKKKKKMALTIEAPESTPISIKRKKPEELKLPAPIMVMGMMKAGTTSIYSYFKCGMDLNVTKLSHYDCKPAKDPQHINMSCGRKMSKNIEANKHPFEGMDQFHLYGELDGNTAKGVVLPQYSYLQQIYDAHPNATWILNLRDPHKWLNSIDRWLELRQRFIWSNLPPHLPRVPKKGKSKPGVRITGEKDEDMITFYKAQAQRVRGFAMEHPSIHLVEVHIDQPDASEIMEDAFGISKQCWGNKNVNTGEAVWREH